jgi:hypothetical protein
MRKQVVGSVKFNQKRGVLRKNVAMSPAFGKQQFLMKLNHKKEKERTITFRNIVHVSSSPTSSFDVEISICFL